MGLLVVIFGLLSGSLLSVLIGMIGSSRRLGFGWSFLISLVFSPLVGLICVLLSEKLPSNEPKRWGCIGVFIAVLGFFFLAMLFFVLLTGGVVLAAA